MQTSGIPSRSTRPATSRCPLTWAAPAPGGSRNRGLNSDHWCTPPPRGLECPENGAESACMWRNMCNSTYCDHRLCGVFIPVFLADPDTWIERTLVTWCGQNVWHVVPISTGQNKYKTTPTRHHGYLFRYTVEPLNVDTLKSGHLVQSGHFIFNYRTTPLKSGHFSNQDTSLIRTLFLGPVHIWGFHWSLFP